MSARAPVDKPYHYSHRRSHSKESNDLLHPNSPPLGSMQQHSHPYPPQKRASTTPSFDSNISSSGPSSSTMSLSSGSWTATSFGQSSTWNASKPGFDTLEEDDDDLEALLAEPWQKPDKPLSPESSMIVPHPNELTEQPATMFGTWRIPSADTLCAQIGHQAQPKLHRCMANAFLVPVVACKAFSHTPCARCQQPVHHDDESCTRCPTRWLRVKTGCDETSYLGSRSRLLTPSSRRKRSL